MIKLNKILNEDVNSLKQFLSDRKKTMKLFNDYLKYIPEIMDKYRLSDEEFQFLSVLEKYTSIDKGTDYLRNNFNKTIFDKVKIPITLPIYRGTNKSIDFIDKLKVGKKIHLKISSFSFDKKQAWEFVFIQKNKIPCIIKIIGKKYCLPIEKISDRPKEKEVLIYGDFNVEKIEKIEWNNNQHNILLRAIE